MTHLYMLVFPALLTPLREELGMTLGEALDLAFLSYLLYGVCALPAGFITDRWSARWMLVICLALTGGGAVLAGLCTTPATLAAALALLGIGASIYHPTGMALISRTFVARRGWALGINGVFGNVGLASAPFITGLLTSLYGWRVAYLALGGLGLFGALWVAAWSLDERAAEDENVLARGDGGVKRYFVVLCVAMTLGGLAYRASSVVMPTYFEARATFLVPFAERLLGAGGKIAAATTLTSIVYLVGIVGQMIGGRIADRRDLRLSYIALHLGTIPALVAMVWLAELPLLFAAMLYVLFSLGMQPIENSLVAKLTPPEWRSSAYGLKFVLTFGIGALAVLGVGNIEQRAGLGAVFGAVVALEITLVSVAFALWAMSRTAIPRVAN